MESLKPFLIPIAGLKAGIHQFDFQIDETFFQNFENSPISAGKVQLSLEFDKRSDMIILRFNLKGRTPTACDRCMADINLPFEGNYTLIVKYEDESDDTESDLVYINREETILDVSKFAYEYICLSIPLIKVYNCDEETELPCNTTILDRLNQQFSEDDDKEPPTNPIWDALKDLK